MLRIRRLTGNKAHLSNAHANAFEKDANLGRATADPGDVFYGGPSLGNAPRGMGPKVGF